jgi:hypothetical protein
VTHRESCAHTRRISRYGIGIRKTKVGKYTARCTYRDKERHLGTFDTPEEAQKAREDFLAAMEYFERVA